jgi:hypothetical protein
MSSKDQGDRWGLAATYISAYQVNFVPPIFELLFYKLLIRDDD